MLKTWRLVHWHMKGLQSTMYDEILHDPEEFILLVPPL